MNEHNRARDENFSLCSYSAGGRRAVFSFTGFKVIAIYFIFLARFFFQLLSYTSVYILNNNSVLHWIHVAPVFHLNSKTWMLPLRGPKRIAAIALEILGLDSRILCTYIICQ